MANSVLSTKSNMIGRKCPTGVGGRDCACCGQAPGKSRKLQKRFVKRSERQSVSRAIRNEGY